MKQDRSSWTREQIEYELDSSLTLYQIAMRQYVHDQAEIARLRELNKRMYEDDKYWFDNYFGNTEKHDALMQQMEQED